MRNVFLFFLFLFLGLRAHAQSPTISYPSVAGNLTRGYSQSNLTVKLVFNGVCSGTVRLGLPASVTYVPGSVVKTSGTSGVSIAESVITDLSKPQFSISGVVAVGDEITFTVARRAGCGSLATAKDSVYFIAGSGCSDGSEVVGTVNTYNIFAPSLSITPASALTGAVIGTTTSRTTTVTNGGNGALDTLRFYVVYPNGGIVNTSGTNAITANSVSFTPSSTSGDTLFYKIFGATLFGGDNLLTSGETVTIQEPMKVVKCNTTTTFGAGWGRSSFVVCAWTTGTSAMSMATGVPNFTALSSVRGTYVDKCTPYNFTLSYTNGGTGNTVAATMYDVVLVQGGSVSVPAIAGYPSWLGISNGKIGTTSVSFTTTASGSGLIYYANLANLLSSDPDGAGVGLDDIDGDGFYDDLAPGKTVALTSTATINCSSTCGQDINNNYASGTIQYRLMCGTSTVTADARYSGANTISETAFSGISYIPANINAGVPFRLELKAAVYENSSSFDNANTRYRWKVPLTAGWNIAGTGSPVYGTTAVTYSLISGGASGVDTMVYTSPSNSLRNFYIDMIYTCGTSGLQTLNYQLEKIDNITTGCMCHSAKICASVSTNVVGCGTPCGSGPTTYAPSIRRVDNSLGWTDYTLSTRQVASAISAYDLSKALYLDTIQIFGSARQNNTATNLHMELSLAKTTLSPTGQNKLQALNADVYVYRSGVLIGSCTGITGFSSAASTATTQSVDWDLTSCLPSGGLLAGDSIATYSRYVVALNGGLPQQDIQSGGTWTFYNLIGGTTKEGCNSLTPEMYLVGTNLVNGFNAFIANGCSAVILGGNTNNIARRFNTSGTMYASEYRPVFYIDSIVAMIPTGYQWNSTNLQNSSPAGGPNFTSLTPVVRPGNVYSFINPGTWTTGQLTVTNTYAKAVTFNVSPTCATLASENINFKVYIRDYYYAYAGKPTPTGFAYILDNTSATVVPASSGQTLPISYPTSGKPSLSLSNLTGTVQGVSNTHYWDVRIANSGLNTAPYVWLGVPTKSGISVTSLVDLGTSSPITAIPYAGGTWYQLSTAGISSGSFKDYRINFTYSTCNLDSLKVYAGWNCASYPTDPSTYACGKDSLFLKLDPQPSQVQLSVIRQPGGGSSINLCTTDSVSIVVNSAQAANLVNPYVTFYPPAGSSVSGPVMVEYPRGSGNYQAATTSALPGGGVQINLSAHTAIGTNGMLGTANASPTYSPLGADREAKVTVYYTTTCDYTSGTSLTFNAYGSRPCGNPAIDNGIASTTSALNITGASAAGGAGVAISFGGGATAVSCGSSLITLSLVTTPTSLGTASGDTMSYTLPVGLAYAGNLTAGFTALVSGGSGSPTIVKIPMPTGVAPSTPINYSFDVVPSGGGCGTMNIGGAYQRKIASLMCGATACASSSVVISTATSPSIVVNKPNLVINNVSILDTTAWRQANWYANHVKVYYSNNGTQSYTANTDTIEFFCTSSATTPFAKMPLTKNVAVGASDSDEYRIMMPIGACSLGNVITARIQTQTAANTPQCLCTSSAFSMAGVGLPLSFLSSEISVQSCDVRLSWQYNKQSSLAAFAVERSRTGADFQVLQLLDAYQTSFADLTPRSGTWYYRIRAIHADGTADYTGTMTASTSNCVGHVIHVYPNPVQDLLTISLQSNAMVQTYVLYDMTGKILKSGSLSGNGRNTLDVSGLAKGCYQLRIQLDGESSLYPISITR